MTKYVLLSLVRKIGVGTKPSSMLILVCLPLSGDAVSKDVIMVASVASRKRPLRVINVTGQRSIHKLELVQRLINWSPVDLYMQCNSLDNFNKPMKPPCPLG